MGASAPRRPQRPGVHCPKFMVKGAKVPYLAQDIAWNDQEWFLGILAIVTGGLGSGRMLWPGCWVLGAFSLELGFGPHALAVLLVYT